MFSALQSWCVTVLLAVDAYVGARATHKSVYVYCEAARVHWEAGCGGSGGVAKESAGGRELFSH